MISGKVPFAGRQTTFPMKKFFLSLLFPVLFFGLPLGATPEEPGAGEHSVEEAKRGEVSIRFDEEPLDRNPARPVVTSYADALEPARAAVVSIFSTKMVTQRSTDFSRRFNEPELDPFFRRFWDRDVPPDEQRRDRRERAVQGLGSGVIMSADGYIMTNHHVIDGADEIRVALSDRREFDARLVGTDPQTDVAVLKIDVEEGVPFATLTDSESLRVGDIVFALGNPLGVGQTVTMGIISATGRSQMRILGEESYENFIQTDAAINRGNSGGALVDAYGRVIGINTAIISGTGGNIGIGFAIPINMAANVMQGLVSSGRVARGYLGVILQSDSEFTPEERQRLGVPPGYGARITQVSPTSPAKEAGLQIDDVVMAINQSDVYNAQVLRLLIAQYRPGQEVAIHIIRNQEPVTIRAKLGDLNATTEEEARPAAPNEFLPGVLIQPLTEERRARFGIEERLRGVVVTEVREDSPHAANFVEGTVILEVNQRRVKTIKEAKEALREGRNAILFNYRGSHRYHSVTIR